MIDYIPDAARMIHELFFAVWCKKWYEMLQQAFVTYWWFNLWVEYGLISGADKQLIAAVYTL